jgi:hypothetical protein
MILDKRFGTWRGLIWANYCKRAKRDQINRNVTHQNTAASARPVPIASLDVTERQSGQDDVIDSSLRWSSDSFDQKDIFHFSLI